MFIFLHFIPVTINIYFHKQKLFSKDMCMSDFLKFKWLSVNLLFLQQAPKIIIVIIFTVFLETALSKNKNKKLSQKAQEKKRVVFTSVITFCFQVAMSR